MFYMIFHLYIISIQSSLYAGIPTLEKEKELKHIMFVSGLKKRNYWIGTFIFDLFISIPIIIIPIIISVVLDFRPHETTSKVFYLNFLFLSINVIPLGYCWSFIFKKSQTCFKLYPIILIFIYWILPGTFTLLYLTYIQWLIKLSSIIGSVLSPLYTFFLAAFAYGLNLDRTQDRQGWIYIKNGDYYIFVLVGQKIIFWIIIYLFERHNEIQKFQQIQGYQEDYNLTDDIKEEKERVFEIANNDNIRAKNLTKEYNSIKAVDNITFGVEQEQILGLVGPNGAGKSTTFQILTGGISKTNGIVELFGKQCQGYYSEVANNIGIQRQEDTIWDNLTVQDHLIVMAGIKGLYGKDKQECIDFFIKELELEEYRNVQAKNLSGGNKRRLCLVISLIGGSTLIFLDEPTTGIDPFGRRRVWNLIKFHTSVHKASIVFTSHSMTEVEALCHKIGVLVKGRLKCIGSIEDLKKRYSNGIRVTMKTSNNETKTLFQKSFQCKIIREDTKEITFLVAQQSFKYSQMFSFLIQQRDLQNINEFTISQSNLEQIFLQLVKDQKSEELDNFVVD